MRREDLTKQMLIEAGIEDMSLKDATWTYWHNPISKTSMRLSYEGFQLLTKVLNIEPVRVKIKSSMLGNNLRAHYLLDKHLTTPFYIVRKDTIMFFGTTDAMMLQLMGGDLDNYLENFE